MYQPDLGRWFNIDALAEIKFDWTPYNYTSNDPINRIDPDGNTDYKVHYKTSVDKDGTRHTTAYVNVVYNVVNLSKSKSNYDQHYSSTNVSSANKKFSYSDKVKNAYGESVSIDVKVNVTFRSISPDKFDKIKDNENILLIVDEIPGESDTGKTVGLANFGGNVAAVEAGESMSTILHELGHNLGFAFDENDASSANDDHHSNDKSHLMYPTTGGGKVNKKDLKGIWAWLANFTKNDQGQNDYSSGNSKQNAKDFIDDNDITTTKKID